MKQTVFNFNQQAILDLTKINDEGKEIRLDATDLLILDWFIYFTPNMTSINVNGKIYYWLSYSKLQEDLPFLDFKKRTFTDKLKKLCDLEVLSFHYEKNQGSITYYGFGNNYLKLIEDTKRVATNVGGCSENNNGVALETTTGLHSTQQQDSSINNNSNIDSSNNLDNNNYNNLKEKYKKENFNEILDYWNTKNIIHHKELTEKRKKAIAKVLKEYSIDDIKLAIDHYAEMYHSKYEFCNYDWNLEVFLTRDKGFTEFLDDGSKWVNYCKYKSKPKTVMQVNGLPAEELPDGYMFNDNNF